MKMWQILLMFICAGCLSVGLIIGIPAMENHETRKQKRQDNRCMVHIEDYVAAYEEYLLFKYDGRTVYNSDITDVDWIEIKRKCPGLYEEYVLPIKTKWDSIRFIPVEKTILEGVPQYVLDHKVKIKEIEKASTKIKVKKSDGVDIENIQNSDTYIHKYDTLPSVKLPSAE